MVRGVFSVAMMAVPSWEGFVKASKQGGVDKEVLIVEQIGAMVAPFGGLLSTLDDFYTSKSLPN